MKSKVILLLIVLLFVLAYVSYIGYISDNPPTVKLGSVHIPTDDLKDLTEPIGEGKFLLCHIDTNKCVVSQKIKIGE